MNFIPRNVLNKTINALNREKETGAVPYAIIAVDDYINFKKSSATQLRRNLAVRFEDTMCSQKEVWQIVPNPSHALLGLKPKYSYQASVDE